MGSTAHGSTRERATPVHSLTQTRRSVCRRGSGVRPAPGSVTALRDVTLTIERGELVGLAGPSGSGKSTLLHAIGGLLEPTTGVVEVLGTDVTALSTAERTRYRHAHVGFVFQQFHLLPSLSARANVAVPLIQAGVRKRKRHDRADTLLEYVGLGDRLDHRPGQLSGGEQQRVAIARALVTDPDVVLADEPTGELDTETGSQVLDLLGDVAADRTVLVASHDEHALAATDRVVHLRDGAVVTDG
ncbi:ABC transporter ATP-binding protein [Natrialbaceae archaeon A-CW1-1]